MAEALAFETHALAQQLEQAVPELALAFVPVASRLADLVGVEMSILSDRAVKKRRREFQAGRTAARQVLAKLGCAETAVGKLKNGAPDWPAGISGSISHTDDLAVAAAMTAAIGFGIDLEPNERLPNDVVPLIATKEELHTFRTALPAGILPCRAIFCAKEATYKAISATLGKVIDFSDVELISGSDSATFRSVARHDLIETVKKGRLLAGVQIFQSEKTIVSIAFSALESV